MMQVQLTNVVTDDSGNVTFGIMTTDGRSAKVDAFYYDWDGLQNIYIENIPKFIHWTNQQNLEVEDIEDVDYDWLLERADDYTEAQYN